MIRPMQSTSSSLSVCMRCASRSLSLLLMRRILNAFRVDNRLRERVWRIIHTTRRIVITPDRRYGLQYRSKRSTLLAVNLDVHEERLQLLDRQMENPNNEIPKTRQ